MLSINDTHSYVDGRRVRTVYSTYTYLATLWVIAVYKCS